jgi:ATP-dependent RNA helicase DeaD
VERIAEAGHTEAALEKLLTRVHQAQGLPRRVTPVTAPTARGATRGPVTARQGRAERGPSRDTGDWVSFQVSWGHVHGADARRLLAMLCRRGNVRGADIGAIRIGERSSEVQVASNVAEDFAKAALPKDPRNPRVHVRPFLPGKAAPPRPAPRGKPLRAPTSNVRSQRS